MLVRLGLHDLAVGSASLFLWSWLIGVTDLRTHLPLFALRVVIWVAHARALLRPAHEWEVAGAKRDEGGLLAANRALDEFERRFAPVYAFGWFACLGLAMLLPALGLPSTLDVGPPERVAGALLLVALFIGELISTRPILATALGALNLQVKTELLARGSQPELRHGSLFRHMSTSFVLSVIAILLTATIGWEVWASEVREGALEHQRRVAEVAALAIQGEAPIADGLQIVTSDELPSELEPEEDSSLRSAIVPGRGLVIAAAPLGGDRWVVAAGAPDFQFGRSFGLLFAYLGILAVIAGVTTRDASRAVLGPLEHLEASVRQLVDEGEVHGIDRLVSLHGDEVGQLAQQFNRLLDLLTELTQAANAVAEGNLEVEIDHPGELHDAFRGMLARLREVVGRIRGATTELNATSTALLELTRQHENAAGFQARRMREVDDSVGALSNASAGISGALTTVRDNAERAASATDGMATNAQQLELQTKGIAEALEAIEAIADRSDLLALNGSLEAVRAGEAGRGFALVAAEMRRLAERVSSTVTVVRSRLEGIEQASADTIGVIRASHELAEQTAAAAREIAELMRQQSQEAEHVSATVGEATAQVIEGTAVTTQTRASAESLQQQARDLEALANQFLV